MQTQINVFSPQWFDQHQERLLWALNALPRRRKIVSLTPSTITRANRDGTFTLTAYARDVIARKLYETAKPLWWGLHWWDAIVANPLVPAWNAGFDTLATQKPQSGSGGGNTTCDGEMYRNAVESFATIRAAAAATNVYLTTVIDVTLDAWTTTDNYVGLHRAGMTFDTSGISGGTVTAATVTPWINNKYGTLGEPALHVAAFTPAANNTIATGDYDACGSSSFGNIAYASVTAGAYNTITLSDYSGISTSGVTALSFLLSWDILNSGPTWSSGTVGGFRLWSADVSADNATKLDVTYTAAGGATFTPQVIMVL